MEFFTIGVYNSTKDDFFNKLIVSNIDTFCDIRKRRGVRGAKYSFVNSKRLQNSLEELDIKYCYEPGLAPTSEIRELQKEADAKEGILKRDRNKLGKLFSVSYKNKILKNFNFEEYIEKLKRTGSEKIVLFCVEEQPEACHRSIVTEKLNSLGYKISHL